MPQEAALFTTGPPGCLPVCPAPSISASPHPLPNPAIREVDGIHRTGKLVPIDINVAVCCTGAPEETLFVGFFRSRLTEQAQGSLLTDTFPPEIVNQLLANPQAPIAERFEVDLCLCAPPPRTRPPVQPPGRPTLSSGRRPVRSTR